MSDKPQDATQPLPDAEALRQRAEAQVRAMKSPDPAAQTPEEIQQMLHELRVHQIELEMQNEELRTAQVAIEAVRARYSDLYDLAPVGYCTVSEKGLILEANLTAARLLGTARSALVEQPFSRFILKEDQDRYYLHRKQLLATGEAPECELRLVKPDGTFFWVHLAAIAAQAGDGAPAARMTFSDISKHKQHENELRIARELSERMIEDGPVAITLVNRDGKIVLANRYAEQILGLEKPTIKTLSYNDPKWLITAVDGSVFPDERLPFCQVMATGKAVYDIQHAITPPDGARKILSINAAPLHDEQGRIDRVVCSIQDITERKQAEEEYLKFFTITEKALFGSAIADIEGNLVYVNGYFAQIHGYTAKELIGRNLDICHSDAQMPLVRKTIEEVLKKKSIDALEIPHLHKNGHEFPMLMSLAVINDSLGKPKYIAATGFDLTEPQSDKNKLQKTVNEQNVMLNNDPTLIYFKDCYNNIIRVTESVAKATGLTREEIEGRPSKEVYPDMADKYWEDDLEVIKSGKQKHNIVEPLTGVDGSSHWLMTTKVPVKNDSGEIVGICVFATDITDLKNAELELIAAKEKAEESEKRFLLAMKASHDGLFDWNLETNEIYYSPAWKTILGYEDHELPNDFSIWENFTDPGDIKISREMQQKLISKQIDRFVLEFKMKHKSGHWVDILSRAEALFDDKGQAVRIIGTHTDITERKQAEAELDRHRHHLEDLLAERTADLREAETKYRTVADFTYDWETWVDADGHWLYCSPACERVTGYRADEFLARPELYLEITDEKDRTRLLEHLHEGEHSGMRDLELRIHHKNGELRWIEHLCRPVKDAAGTSLGRRVSNRDITERKLADDALRQARDQAEAANRAKSTFLANMSHEIRTPMNAILGLTHLMQRAGATPQQADRLAKIDTAAAHLLTIINDILDFAKIEAERLQLEHVDFRIGEILENLVSLMGHKASEKGLKFLLQLQPGLPARRFNGDPTRLGQILLNLAGNALKFTDRGAITVRARLVEDHQKDALLRWEVADTGIGIDAEAQGRLFAAFEQADNSMTRKYGGTGLGLVISRRLARLMGGEIGVESAPGQGSTFWFTVRLGQASSATAPPAPSAEFRTAEQRLQADHLGARVLLAEDEPINQEVSRGLLVDVGLVVDLAEDGRQALELARRTRYALILMDMQMPVLNGVDATKAIRADSLNQTTHILAMTANAFDEDRQTCLAAGMNDHIAKPVDPQKLYETLLAWLEKCGD